MSERGVVELTEAIWRVEADLDLLDWTTRGVRVWEAGRMAIYYALARQLGIFETPLAQLRPGFGARWRRGAEVVSAGARRHPFRHVGSVDALVFESGRASEVDGRRVCPYTFKLSADLRARGERVVLLGRRTPGQPEKSPDLDRLQIDLLELVGALAARTSAPLLDARSRALLVQVEVKLTRALGRDVRVRQAAAGVLGKYLAGLLAYRRLLALHRPRTVYCVAAYAGMAPLVAAARELGIASVEVQHGIISRYHLGYSFPRYEISRLAYFPDRLYTWGSPWDELMDIALPAERLVRHGFSYFEHRAGKYRDRDKRPGRVIVISQGTIGRQLAETLWRNVDRLGGLEIIYKLHPGEIARWREYPALVRLSELPQVRIAEGGDLYELMSECEWQIGVYSTALHEGLALGLKTAIVDLPGKEYMDAWFARGCAVRFEAFLDVVARRAQGARA